MQVQTLPPGVVVVETVAPGSPADLAGLEPGDQIVAINNQRIDGTGDIRAAISGLAPGDLVQIEISRGSTLFTTQATLAAPPSGSP
jgi:S1-C subfamily serine protease